MSVRILALAGSLRRESLNRRLLHAAAGAARAAGAEVTVVDLREFELPVFDQDIEDAGTPDGAKRLKALFVEHDGLLFACPEYNSSITAALKNAIDWVSRKVDDTTPGDAFRGKVVALLAASPGGFGGLRGLVTVRSILGNLGTHVLPDQVAVPKAHEAFDGDELRDAGARERVERLTAELVRVTGALHG